MRFWLNLRLIVLTTLTVGFFPSSTLGGTSYWEFGLGTGAIKSGQSFFQAVPNSTQLGVGVNGLYAKNITKDTNFIQIHLGMKLRFYSAGNRDGTLNLITPSLLARLEIWRIYFGGGIGKYSLKSAGDASALMNLGLADKLFFPAEVGIEWHIIPDFSLAIEAGGDLISTGTKAIQGCLQMRFYFDAVGRKSGSRKLDGWRYPFGIPFF